MAKKAKHHPVAPLGPRIQRTINEGRFQQALDLAKQLHKQEPTPAHLELLKQAYLGRAKQLREQNYNRDAVVMLDAARNIDAASPAWIEQVAREMAQAGGLRQAFALAESLPPETPSIPFIRAHAVDAALLLEAAGRELLPPALQPDFDRLVQAFHLVENGQDEDARTALQEIGLRSPFLEWKVLLRGFQAYYQNDDARALENWQRLTPDRLPARLAAPFRGQIDPAYLAAQPSVLQVTLQGLIDRVQGAVLPQELRRLRKSMEQRGSLATAFRQAEALLPQLKQQAPQLVPRLAACFYWAATDTGPDDIARYQRVFGAPAFDPHFHRLQALAYDRAHDPEASHPEWQAYEKELADHPEIFPPGQATAARALIWLRMGLNAASIPSKKKVDKLPRFLRDHPDRPKPLKPSPEVCFEKAIELSPDRLEPYEELFKYQVAEENASKATKAAKGLLDRFPDHVPTLTALGDLRMKEKKYREALESFQQAQHNNPLDRELRQRVGAAHLFQARIEVEAGHYEAARQHYQDALTQKADKDQWTILLRLAACEWKAGDLVRGEELLQQALGKAPHPLAVSFMMLTEVIRLNLPKPLKKRFEQEYKAGIVLAPDPAAAAALAEFLASLKGLDVKYTGLKSHETAILKYVNKGQNADWSADQIENVVRALLKLKAVNPARRFLSLASRRFPHEPVFPFLEATTYFIDRPRELPHFMIGGLLATASRLAQALPPSEKRTKLLEDIHSHQQMLEALDPFGGMPGFFGDLFNFDDGEDEDDDDEEDGYW